MNRRQALTGLAALALGGGAGVTLWVRRRAHRRREDEAMQSDFERGRVHVADGWLISTYEAESLALEDAVPLDWSQ